MNNPMFKLKGPKMIAADFTPNFPLKHAEKDVRLAVALGGSLGLGLPIAAAADAAEADDEPAARKKRCACVTDEGQRCRELVLGADDWDASMGD